ncbi:MAG TPA: RagB/SusD family nutrient uptake outer membrane protein, partial [Chryseosolibacter sp.]
MKHKIYIILGVIFLSACQDLDLNPLSEGSSATWYADETQINMSLNDLYREVFWPMDEDPRFNDNPWTDDYIRRNFVSPIISATINGEWGVLRDLWANSYKAISR